MSTSSTMDKNFYDSCENVEKIVNSKVNQDNENNDSEWVQVKVKNKKKETSSLPSAKDEKENTTNSIKQINDEYNKSNVEIVKNLVVQNKKSIIILRGCSGSGKSTLAKQIKFNGTIVSADDYFIDSKGVYKYDLMKLDEAHKHCRTETEKALKNEISPIVVDNTNLKIWEFKDYIKMGLMYGYNIHIMEPNTPWKYKAKHLSDKNVHGVPLEKIKRCLDDFDKNVNLESLINECENELNKKNMLKKVSPSQKPSKPKPSGAFITNINDYLVNSDWSMYNTENNSDSSPISSNSFKTSNGFDSLFSLSKENLSASNSTKDDFNETSNKRIDNDEYSNQTEIDQSKELLKQMFPKVNEEILIDFLVRYQNDVDSVTNILLDSVDLNDSLSNELTEVDQTYQANDANKETRQVESLKGLCTKEVNNLERILEKHYEDQETTQKRNSIDKILKDLNQEINSINAESLVSLEMNDSKNSDISKNESSESEELISQPVQKEILGNLDEDDDPILNLKLTKPFLSTLIQLFGTQEDETLLDNETFDVEIGLNMASRIFNCWKKNRKNNSLNNSTKPVFDLEEIRQIQNDEKLSFQLFDETNMTDPIEKTPVYFSDNGTNPATFSFRQIMAEQAAELQLMKKENSLNGVEMNQANNQKNIANLLKLQQLNEKYMNLVDKNLLKDILEANNYNFNETCKCVNEFFGLTQVKEPNKRMSIKSSDKKNQTQQKPNDKVDYLNESFVEENYVEYSRDSLINRTYSKKHIDIRQSYFDKASEAHKRGWGAVAQYYAECAHQETIKIKNSNEISSMKIFAENNPDFKKLNTVDLHGLQVKEALNVLKQVINEKKNELKSFPVKKRKSYIFVITGCGKHSENNAKLRPNIINYLSQTGVQFKELHIGLLKVDLT